MRGCYPAGLVLAALLALLALAAPPAALSVRGGEFHGSAVVWDASRGHLLTALHVVEEMPSVEVALPSGELVPARVVDRDPMLDLALLAVDAPLPPAPPLARAPAAGDPVALAGCPALACGTVAGAVAEPLRSFGGSRYVELAAAVKPGASGGPVLDARGALVGLVDLSIRGGSVTLAVPAARAAARFPRSAEGLSARAQ